MTTVTPAAPLALAKNFLVRASLADADRWEVSWGEGSARTYYDFPRDAAAFFMTCEPSATRADWARCLASDLELDDQEAADLIDTLAGEGMLVDPRDALSPGEEQWLDVEWGDALQLHWSERNCHWAHDYTHNPKVMTRYSGVNVQPDTAPPGPFPCVPAPGKQALVLPDALSLDRPFATVQGSRRTAYQLQDTSISMTEVSTILQWTLKAKWSDGVSPLRVSQSYSRGEPFVGFVAFGGHPPDGAEAYTIYQYDPASNVLAPRPRTVPEQWSDCLWGQQFGDGAPMALILAANWDHFMWKYRFPRAYRWVYTECGAFMQTALTVATGLNLRCWQTPALNDATVSELIGYDEATLSPAYLAVLGSLAGDVQLLASHEYDRTRPPYSPALTGWVLDWLGGAQIDRTLDVGCGTGRSTRWARSFSRQAFGIDSAEAMIAIARSVNDDRAVDFGVGSAEDFGESAPPADLILSASAFEWFGQDAFRLEVLRREPSGVGIVLVWSWLEPLDGVTNKWYRLMRRTLGAQVGPEPDDVQAMAMSFFPNRPQVTVVRSQHSYTADELRSFLVSSSYWRSGRPQREAALEPELGSFVRNYGDVDGVVRLSFREVAFAGRLP